METNTTTKSLPTNRTPEGTPVTFTDPSTGETVHADFGWIETPRRGVPTIVFSIVESGRRSTHRVAASSPAGRSMRIAC